MLPKPFIPSVVECSRLFGPSCSTVKYLIGSQHKTMWHPYGGTCVLIILLIKSKFFGVFTLWLSPLSPLSNNCPDHNRAVNPTLLTETIPTPCYQRPVTNALLPCFTHTLTVWQRFENTFGTAPLPAGQPHHQHNTNTNVLFVVKFFLPYTYCCVC